MKVFGGDEADMLPLEVSDCDKEKHLKHNIFKIQEIKYELSPTMKSVPNLKRLKYKRKRTKVQTQTLRSYHSSIK